MKKNKRSEVRSQKSEVRQESSLKSQKGQILILLLLVMLVTLTVALAIAQRSLTYLSTSNKTEQGNRAFSAAQSGIDQALHGANPTAAPITIPLLSNESSAVIPTAPLLPPENPTPGYNEAIEYPPIGKDTPAQIWIARPFDPNSYNPSNPTANVFGGFSISNQFVVYYGTNDPSDPNTYTALKSAGTAPAVEVNYVTYDKVAGVYLSHKYYYDDSTLARIGNGNYANGTAAAQAGCNTYTITTTSSVSVDTPDRPFACVTPSIPDSNLPAAMRPTANEIPIMIRVRLLYSDISQPIAVQPAGGSYFPPQVQLINSTGSAGQTQKRIQVFKAPFVVPPFFDYAIFSQTDIIKKCTGC